MEANHKELNIATIKEVLRQYLMDKGFRNTPERYTILEEIYSMEHHFNVDDLYLLMMQKKYHLQHDRDFSGCRIDQKTPVWRKNAFLFLLRKILFR